MQQKTSTPPPVGLLVGAARRSIKQAVTQRLRPRRLSHQQFWLLVALLEHPGQSLRELAGRRHMDSPTASRIMDVLARRGLVRMEHDPEDRRRCSIRLTARGVGLAREVYPLALRTREAVEAGFSEAEKRTLRTMLQRIVANMERFEGEGRRTQGRQVPTKPTRRTA
jgi:DNA-binding MarR family transcriptional regulator